MSKRIVGFLLAFCVVLTLLPIPALADEAAEVAQVARDIMWTEDASEVRDAEKPENALIEPAADTAADAVNVPTETENAKSVTSKQAPLSASQTSGIKSGVEENEDELLVELLGETVNYTLETPNYSTGVKSCAELESRLKSLKSKYVGTYWTINGQSKTWYGDSKYYYGWQCKGFANYIFNDLFCKGNIGGYDSKKYYIPSPNGAKEIGKKWNLESTDSASVKALLSQAQIGDYIQVRRRNSDDTGHSMIVAGVSSSGITIFDCNSDGKCGVRWYTQDWATFASKNIGMSLYHSTAYPKPDAPTITTTTANSETAIKVEWNTVSGADSYILSWRKAGENTQYTDISNIAGTSKAVSNLESATRYFFRVKAVNGSGESDWSTTKYCYTNNEQPEITRVSGSVSSLDLKWKKAQGAKTYEIYRKKYNGDYSKIKSVSNTTTSYTDTALEAGTMYVYKVTAKCEWSNSSGGTDKANCESAEKTKYTHMTAPSLTVKGQTSIQIKWNKNYGNKEYAFHVFRNGADIATVPYSTTSYTDTGLSAGTTYEYQIKSYETNGTGTVDSLKASAKTETPSSSWNHQPTFTRVKGTVGFVDVDLTWEKPQNAVSYAILRKASDESAYTTLASGLTTETYRNNVIPGKEYSYQIVAHCALNGGEWDIPSNVATYVAPQMRKLDINCWVDGVWSSVLTDIATVDTFIDGALIRDDWFDFYESVPVGSTYCFNDIKATSSYIYLQCNEALGGVVTAGDGDISINLIFTSAKMLNPAVFNLAYYKERNPDLVTGFNNDDAGITNHWLTAGIDEGRIASPAFDAVWYMEKYPHLNDGYGEKNYRGALIHYVDFGMSEGAWGSSEFNAGIYRQNYFDLQQGYGDNIVGYAVHYVEAGKAEGRIANARLTVTFDANGGSCDMQSREYTAGLKYDVLPNATRANYAFDGWYTEADGGYQVTADMEDYYAQHHTLYAHWTAIPTERNLVSIEIAARPNKTVYKIGEAWDGAGLSVRATYSDNASEILTSGFTVAGFDSSSAGDKTITVEYQGKSAAFTVSVTESAIGAAQLVIDSQSASPGGKITVPVLLKNNPGIVGFSFAVQYDAEKLEYLSATDGNFSGIADNVSVNDNQLGFAYSSASGANLSGETIVKLTFQAKSGAKGTTKLLLVMDEDFGDSFRAFHSETQQIVSIDVNTQDGEITIADFIPGDVNDSGRVDNDDLILLTRYRARWKVTINMDAADVDGSGKVDNDDLILLTRYRARWKVTLLPGKVSSG